MAVRKFLEIGHGKVLEFEDFVLFLRRTFVSFFQPYARFDFFYRQFIDIGLMSIPIVLIVGGFVGMVLGVMTYSQFSKLGIESLMGPFLAVPMVSQLGPILTALMILCRVGAAMTAELGTMRVTEQVDALYCFGINPIKTLITPRVLVCTLMLPALTVLSDAIGILGGWFLGIHVYGVNEHNYFMQTKNYFVPFDIYEGLAKSLVFGVIISVFCCFKGFHTKGGASGVGKSIMTAVVVSFIAIIMSNFFISLIARKIFSYL